MLDDFNVIAEAALRRIPHKPIALINRLAVSDPYNVVHAMVMAHCDLLSSSATELSASLCRRYFSPPTKFAGFSHPATVSNMWNSCCRTHEYCHANQKEWRGNWCFPV